MKILGEADFAIAERKQAKQEIDDFLNGKINPTRIGFEFDDLKLDISTFFNSYTSEDIDEEVNRKLGDELLMLPGVRELLGETNLHKIAKDAWVKSRDFEKAIYLRGISREEDSEKIYGEIFKSDVEVIRKLIRDNLTTSGDWVNLDPVTLHNLPF